tara:strand:+ start:933 stop:1370 length:438 start_codon:yes stop_codon:yes gene_type:complete
MKKLILLIFLATPLFAQVKMVPLNEYIGNENNSDPNVLIYLTARCAAINFIIAEDATDNNKELYERGSLLGEAFILKALEVRKTVRPDDPPEENLRVLVELTSAISSEYVDSMNEFYTKEGKSFTGWIIEDISYCSGFYESAMKN